MTGSQQAAQWDELTWFRARIRPVLLFGISATVLMAPIAIWRVATGAVPAVAMGLLFGVIGIALGILGIVGSALQRRAELRQPAARLVLVDPPEVVESRLLR